MLGPRTPFRAALESLLRGLRAGGGCACLGRQDDAHCHKHNTPSTRATQAHATRITWKTGRVGTELCRCLSMSGTSRMHAGQVFQGLTNQSVQGQSLCKNKDEDHSHEELGLLCISSAKHQDYSVLVEKPSMPIYNTDLHAVQWPRVTHAIR